MTCSRYVFTFWRRDAPEVCKKFRPKKRGRRERRVLAAPAVSCAKNAQKSAHEHTGTDGAFRHSLLRAAFAHGKPPCKHISRATLPRPPQPVLTFVTMANAPLLGTGWREFSVDLLDGLSGKFFSNGLDRILS